MSRPQPFLPVLTALLLVAAPVLAAPTHTGTWSASVQPTQLQLSLRQKGPEHGQMSSAVPLTAFQGLSTADGSSTPFQLTREAGTFLFQGSFSNGEGAGHFQFEPSEAYARSMAGLGYPQLTPDEHFQLALFDITPAWIKELASVGYTKLALVQLVKLRIHGIDAAFVRALARASKKP